MTGVQTCALPISFSGVFPLVNALVARGARVLVHDPMYTDDELRAFGWEPFRLGRAADAAIIQADHREYASLAPQDVPGVRLLVDGRRITAAELWAGVPRLVIGQGR